MDTNTKDNFDTPAAINEVTAKEIYLLHKVRNLNEKEIHGIFPKLSIGAIHDILYKASWIKTTDKLDKKYGFSTEKMITPFSADSVRKAYIDVRLHGMTVKAAADKYGMAASALSNILIKNRWKTLTDEIDKEFNLSEYKSTHRKPLDENTVIRCYKRVKLGCDPKQIASEEGIPVETLRAIMRKISWKKVTDNVDLQLSVSHLM